MGSLSVIFNEPITTKFLTQDLKSGLPLGANGGTTSIQSLLQSATLQKMQMPSGQTMGGGVLTFDAVTFQNHSIQNTVTQHPVEQGITISDHMQTQPRSLTIEGVFSDSPFVLLGSLGAAAGLSSGGTGLTAPSSNPLSAMFSTFTKQMGLALTAYNVLLALVKSKSVIIVVTAWELYKNMAITSVSAPRRDSRGRICVTIELIQVVVVGGTAPPSVLAPTINLADVMPLFPDVVMMAQAASFAVLLGVQAGTGKGL